MSTIFSIIATTLIVAAQSRSDPLFVTYVDFPTCGSGVLDAACLANMGVPGYADHPYNVVNLAFYVPEWNDPYADAVKVWNNPGGYLTSSFKQTLTGSSNPSASQLRSAIKQSFTNAGVKLMLAVFGGTSHPMGTYSESSLTQSGGLCDRIANVVNDQEYDGVDIDFEQTAYFQSGTAESWLCTLTNCLKQRLNSGKLITHAPQAPYMGHSGYPNGAYLGVEQSCGDNIDWYNTQFYNQGSTTYSTFQTLFNSAVGWSTNTAVYEIIQGNNFKGWSIPSDKLVVGKFIRSGVDGSAGWMSGDTLKSAFDTALASSSPSWNAGFMTWQYIGDKESNFAFSNTVVSAWGSSPVSQPASNPVSPPVSAPVAPPVSIPTPRPTPRPTPAPTPSTGGGGSDGYITVHIYSDQPNGWWMQIYLSNYGSTTISAVKLRGAGQWSYTTAYVSWTSSSLGPIFGVSPGPDMRAPLDVKLVRSDGREITSENIISTRAAGASGTMTQSFGSGFTEDDDDNDGLSWTAYFAIIMCIIVLIACIIAGICYKKRKAKKEVTFTHGDDNKHAEIEIGDGPDTNTQI